MSQDTNTTEMVNSDTTETVVEQPEGDAGDALQKELEEVRVALKKANSEAAKRRKQLEQFEREAEERREAEMSELEKAQAAAEKAKAEAERAKAELDNRIRVDAFYGAVAGANLQWANDLARRDAAQVLDLSEIDPENETELKAVVKALKEQRPFLFATSKAPDIDGEKRGGSTKTDEKEQGVQEAARRYGVTYVPPD